MNLMKSTMKWQKHAVVLGAGWIGANLISELVTNKTVKVRAVVKDRVTHTLRYIQDQYPTRVEILKTDLENPENLREIIDFGTRPTIYQFAAKAYWSSHTSSNDPTDFDHNAQINRNLFDVVSSGFPVSAIGFSSSYFTYKYGVGGSGGQRLTNSWNWVEYSEEDLDPLIISDEKLAYIRKINPYAWEKICSERLYQQLALLGVPINRFRFGNVYWPGQRFHKWHPHLVPNLLGQIYGDKKVQIYGDGSHTRAWIHVRDVARWIRMAMESLEQWSLSSIHPLFNLWWTRDASGHSVIEIAEILFQWMGKRRNFDHINKPWWHSLGLSTNKASDYLSWTPEIWLKEWLDETIGFFRDNNLEIWASTVVLDKKKKKTALVWHPYWSKWNCPGGWPPKNSSPKSIAISEVRKETNLNIHLLREEPSFVKLIDSDGEKTGPKWLEKISRLPREKLVKILPKTFSWKTGMDFMFVWELADRNKNIIPGDEITTAEWKDRMFVANCDKMFPLSREYMLHLLR